MYNFAATIVFIEIVLAVIYLIKKIDDNYFKRDFNIKKQNNKIYKAAYLFSQGAGESEIKNVLLNSLDFDEDDIDDILKLSMPYRTDKDGGYKSFIGSVKKVMGKSIF